jgi:DNA-binding MarR family transcriptional regulator
MGLQVTDLESRMVEDDHQALRLWLRLLACTTRVESVVRNRLRSEFGTTLPRFDLMSQLEREPGGLTMGELSQRLMVTGGNVTGITDQLEREGLVRRDDDPNDRRAYRVRLTPAGRKLFRRMAAIHEGWIVELLDGWSPAQKLQVHGLLSLLKRHLAEIDKSPAPRRKPRTLEKVA